MTKLHYYLVGIGSAAVLGIAALLVFVVFKEVTKERPHFNSGAVITKHYDPAHNVTEYRQQYTGEDCSYNSSTKSESCSAQYITVPYEVYVPDHWSIQIKNCNVDHKDGSQWVDKNGQPKCFTKWVSVDNSTYRQLTIGQRYGV